MERWNDSLTLVHGSLWRFNRSRNMIRINIIASSKVQIPSPVDLPGAEGAGFLPVACLHRFRYLFHVIRLRSSTRLDGDSTSYPLMDYLIISRVKTKMKDKLGSIEVQLVMPQIASEAAFFYLHLPQNFIDIKSNQALVPCIIDGPQVHTFPVAPLFSSSSAVERLVSCQVAYAPSGGRFRPDQWNFSSLKSRRSRRLQNVLISRRFPRPS